MRVLGIETSCDETGVAVYDTDRGLLAHALYSQVGLHAEYGGVVPELASRDHVRKLLPLVRQTLAEAGLGVGDIDGVAYTAGPGLVGALLVGAGVHITQTVGLALATDLAREDQQANVVGLMYVSLLLGSIVSALAFGAFLTDFTPGRLIQVIQGCAVVTVFLNLVATWKQEALNSIPLTSDPAAMAGTFRQSWDSFIVQRQALRRLIVIGIGTLAFTMSDVLLEPYGGQALGLGVGMTTRLTAILAGGSLVGFTIASQILSRGSDPVRLAGAGALMGLPGFAMIIVAAPIQSVSLFSVGVLLIGCGAGLFGHGTLTATMRDAPKGQVGMALGAWGAVQATAAGAGAAIGGVVRDLAGVLGTGLPVWCSGAAAPPSVAGLTFVDWQRPVACGGVAVQPGSVGWGRCCWRIAIRSRSSPRAR